ncbi:MAG: cell division protein FtsQ/DivIB [Proteobacteria bacterium]|nr:cell division protein FtsQ/DivIB [Pseudomonadota bacterium]
MNATQPAPLDVRLMNMTATVLFVGFALGVLGAAGAWLLRQPAFAIGHIAVEGDLVHTSALSLRANVAPQLAGNFFTVDLEAARTAFEQVPWVRSAHVRREFPSGLRVRLQEHDVAAYWGPEGSATLVDSQGQVFEADADDVEQEGLPRLMGAPERSAEMLDMARQLATVLAPLGPHIDQLELTGNGSWRVLLVGGAVLELGSGTKDLMLERAARLVHTLPGVAQQQGRRADALEYADLRYADGYALRLRGVTTVANEAQRVTAQRAAERAAATRAAAAARTAARTAAQARTASKNN